MMSLLMLLMTLKERYISVHIAAYTLYLVLYLVLYLAFSIDDDSAYA
jgi:hypothetical protein